MAISVANTLEGMRAVLVTHHCEPGPIASTCEELRSHGAEVDIIELSSDVRTRHEEPTVSLHDADPNRYDVLILADGVRGEALLSDFVRTFVEENTPVAAIGRAPAVLMEAHLVDGRKLTSHPELSHALKRAGARWVDQQVAIDGNLITSRTLSDLPAFHDAIVGMMESPPKRYRHAHP